MQTPDQFADQLPVGIFRIDRDRRYVYVNRLAAAMSGRRAADYLGKTIRELTGDADLTAFVTAQSDRVFATGESAEYEMPARFNPAARLLVNLIPEVGPEGTVTAALGVVTDVTAVRRTEERLRRAMDAARVCTWDYDAAGGHLRIDPELWHWLGLDPAAAPQTAATWATWLHPDDAAGRAAAVAALEAGREIAEYDFRATAADGAVRWFRVRTGADRTADGRVRRLYGTATEVTGRKRDELARQEAEDRFRSAADTAPAVLWITDPADACTFLSRGWYEFTGQTPAEGLGFGWLDAIHPADREAAKASFLAATAARRPFDSDYRLRRADGDYRSVIDAGRPWVGPGGEFRGYVGSVIDIEDRKRAEGAHQASERRFTEFLNHLPANGWVKDADGRYLFVNDALLSEFGVPADHFLGRADADLYPADIAAALRAKDREVLDTGRPARTNEVVPVPGAGAARHWLSVKFPVTAPDGRPAVGGIALDQTEHVRATERAVQAQKLESLGVLAGGIAHDFNNILTAVLGYASLARQEAAGSAALDDYLGQIETAAQRAGELCAQMLAYAGKGRQTTVTLDLNQLVREMAQLLSAAIGKSAVLRYQFTDDLPPVTVDPTQLRQVVMNLITNAADAIGERSGVITLTTGILDADERYLVELGAADLPPARYVSLEVSDTGCGMTAETAARVFEPFFTTKFTGRGLGLSAVRGILKQHRGAIKVYSAPGQGTTFKVLLPQAGDVAPTRPPAPPVTADRFGAGRLLLVVDDEEAIRAFAKRLLEKVGFVVELATDGRTGLEAFRRRPAEFAAVLLDLTMPHLDGGDAFREIRRVRADVPVILTSGFGRDDATAGLEGKGLAGFVRKPFRVQELLATLRAVLGPSPG